MARIRSTHPGQWTDENFVSCSPLARLLALGIRNEADDHGVFEWKPTTLKMRLLPADNVDMDRLLSELVENRQIVNFESGGKKYGAVRNFQTFQRVKKPNPIHPYPPEIRKYTGDKSTPVRNQFGSGGEIPPQREEVGGREDLRRMEGVEGTDSVSPPDARSDCELDPHARSGCELDLPYVDEDGEVWQ